jgi:hypothetical protein
MNHAITGTPAETILHGASELGKNSWLLALQFPDRVQPSSERMPPAHSDVRLHSGHLPRTCRAELFAGAGYG